MSKPSVLNIIALIALVLLPVGAMVSSHKPVPDQNNAFFAVSRGEYSEAVSMLEQSAEAGDSRSNIHLANLYRLGLGVPIDYRKAVSLYSQSAHQGEPSSMVNLALMYRQGLGIEKDAEVAYGWLNLARQYHEPAGQLYMSEMLANHELSGHRVPELKQKYATIDNMPQVDQ